MRIWRILALALLLAPLGSGAVPAPVPAPTAIAPSPQPALRAAADIRPGLWHLRFTGSGEPERDMCVADPRALIQLRHGTVPCDGMVVTNEARLATVQYSCPGAGWGRTSLRLRGPDQVHIDTQGIADKAPFAFAADARRAGECAPGAAR